MPSTHSEIRTRTLGALAQLEPAQAEARRQQAEATLAAGERALGTPEQRSGSLLGGLGVSEAEAAYTGRYVLDENAATGIFGKRGLTKLQGGLSEANALLDRAQELARSGNTEAAAQLKAQAEGKLTSSTSANPQYAAGIRNLYTLQESPEVAAAAKLDSPLGRLAGDVVGTARDLMDPSSAESARVLQAIQGAPLEALEQGRASAVEAVNAGRDASLQTIGAQSRATQRQFRDMGLGSGAARRPYQERQLAGRAEEQLSVLRAGAETEAGKSRAEIEAQTSFERARVLEDSGKFFEQFRTQFATNAAGFAQAFLQNQSGIRDTYQASLDQLASLGAQLSTNLVNQELQMAQMNQQESLLNQQFRLERKAFFEQLGAGLLTGGAGAAGGGAGAAAGGATAGGAAAGGGGSASFFGGMF